MYYSFRINSACIITELLRHRLQSNFILHSTVLFLLYANFNLQNVITSKNSHFLPYFSYLQSKYWYILNYNSLIFKPFSPLQSLFQHCSYKACFRFQNFSKTFHYFITSLKISLVRSLRLDPVTQKTERYFSAK